jgi:hypothetical protein
MNFKFRGFLSVLAVAFCNSTLHGADDKSLWSVQQTLASKKYVDLTHSFAPGIPRWPGFPDETRKTIYWYEKRPDTMGAGFFSEVFTHVGQWGTHVDPPAHFVKGLRTVDQIDLKEMVLPLVPITDRFQQALLLQCEPIGRGAGRTRPKCKIKTQKGWRIIRVGVCPH